MQIINQNQDLIMEFSLLQQFAILAYRFSIFLQIKMTDKTSNLDSVESNKDINETPVRRLQQMNSRALSSFYRTRSYESSNVGTASEFVCFLFRDFDGEFLLESHDKFHLV